MVINHVTGVVNVRTSVGQGRQEEELNWNKRKEEGHSRKNSRGRMVVAECASVRQGIPE